MAKLFAAVATCVALVQVAGAQEIGMVTIRPDAATGVMRADLPARPDGEKVYIVHKGKLVGQATIRSSGLQGGAELVMSPTEGAKVEIGDRISLSPTLDRELPLSAYKAIDPKSPKGGGDGAMDAGVSPMAMAEPAPMAKGERVPLAKGEHPRPAMPRLMPRDSRVPLYPEPAVTPNAEFGILGPYGQGLAAAAPIGTPYLRSPAFAGPPVIYMPQTVSRVLVPASTPYPYQVIPTRQYPYASAPFLRTDIYVNLPYGTYYWPQGYAGTVPVEPQVPAYVTAPSTAIQTAEASYAAQRYIPGALRPEVIAPAMAAPEMPVAPAPVVTPAAPSPIEPISVSPMPPAPVTPAPDVAPPPVPQAAPTPQPLPSLFGDKSAAPVAPPPSTEQAVSPFSPDVNVAVPPVATPSATAMQEGIVVDDKTPDGLVLDPPAAWQASANATDSYERSSLIAGVQGQPKSATFKATVPADGEYEIFLWWVASSKDFRSASVPVKVFTAQGEKPVTIDQTTNNKQWVSIGTFPLKAGAGEKIVTISTEGVTAGPTMNVSVDAMKLVKVR
jgi:hypothetical protein